MKYEPLTIEPKLEGELKGRANTVCPKCYGRGYTGIAMITGQKEPKAVECRCIKGKEENTPEPIGPGYIKLAEPRRSFMKGLFKTNGR